jgi:hypothetical protein
MHIKHNQIQPVIYTLKKLFTAKTRSLTVRFNIILFNNIIFQVVSTRTMYH